MKRIDLIAVIFAVIVIGGTSGCAIHSRKAKEDKCLSHLRMIDSAVYNVALRDRLHLGEIVSSNLVLELVARTGESSPGQTIFACPSGGHYVIRSIGETPVCSYHGDLLMKYPQIGGRKWYDAVPKAVHREGNQ